ncbi:hypothetical protein IYR97_24215 (plasmid) [Pseudomonas fulva]|uniref:Uncharacterized protein n=2 Tax=Pseudomonas putida group TaxID=136845 RepID=A0ABD7BMW0_PSEPU|nr:MULTISPECIES: hypothetical protein [Pseudomonas putida group]QOD01628.1 hypothetical protein ID616_30880 [Pseudomonas putida]QPH46900.1 hypothetical protein IYR97_24215 [Pseudomonas fulva]QPH52075.1 hypothetical protein IZU98_24670 [Pseudomonas fulva]
MKEMSRKDVIRIAGMMGEQSPAALALADYDRRTAAGEVVKIYRGQGSLFVGPEEMMIRKQRRLIV